jgi:gas vesicle protein
MSSGKVLLGVLAGVAAGALVGVLVAPEKGSRTRRNIVRKGEDYLEDLKDKFDDLLEVVNDKITRTHQDADEIVSKGKRKYEDAKKEFKNEMN